MSIESLEIHHVRNISYAKLQFSARLNLVSGLNASGKTSLLEAISVLIQGKSFRTPRIDQLVSHNQPRLMIIGCYRQGQQHYQVGFQREDKRTQVKINGQVVNRMTDLAGKVPLFILTPESHELLASGPKLRRQFLDWGVFHVEHRYLDHWQRFHRILRQRNASLRHKAAQSVVLAWDKSLAIEAGHVDQLRTRYIEHLTAYFQQFCQDLLGLDVSIEYRPGWDSQVDLASDLKRSIEQDQERGYTGLGPQRADLRFLCSKRAVQSVFSRGQQKLLISALILAQLAGTAQDAAILVDDLPAELDPHKRKMLMQALKSTGKQIIVTATEASLLPTEGWPDKKLFHVEHGEIQEVV